MLVFALLLALVAVAFLAAGAFFVAVLVAVFLGAAALLVVAAFFVGAVFAFVAVFFAAGLVSPDLGAASFTGPEEPVDDSEVSDSISRDDEIG